MIRITGNDWVDVSIAVPSSNGKSEYDVLFNWNTQYVNCNCNDCIMRKKGDNLFAIIRGDSFQSCKHMNLGAEYLQKLMETEL